jgi:hypothetical protein
MKICTRSAQANPDGSRFGEACAAPPAAVPAP